MIRNITQIVFVADVLFLLYIDPKEFLYYSDYPFNFCSRILTIYFLRSAFDDKLGIILYHLSYMILFFSKGVLIKYLNTNDIQFPNITYDVLFLLCVNKYTVSLETMQHYFKNELISFIFYVSDKVSHAKGFIFCVWYLSYNRVPLEIEIALLMYNAYLGCILQLIICCDNSENRFQAYKSFIIGIFFESIAYFVPYYVYKKRYSLLQQLNQTFDLDSFEFNIFVVVSLFLCTEGLVQFYHQYNRKTIGKQKLKKN